MSSNLALVAACGDEFTLVQTPTHVTDRALAVQGNHGAAVAVYELWLRDSRMWSSCDHDEGMCWACWGGYAPGFTAEELK